ncbi:MAG: SDR family NAD(P)-dependent oxidoreductase [Bacillota bacterium]|nr:MAG: SDR family NAD(P)-dependent oxidoreductase [Bacillota bacterium]
MKWPEELNFLNTRKEKQKETTQDMTGFLSVVSGATSGIGLSTVKVLAKAGSNIVMVCRNQEKALPIKQELESKFNIKVDIVIADFMDFESVRRAAATISQTYARINVLINSVGIHSTRKRYNKDGIESSFCVNHLSVFLFTELLLDKMKQSAPSRIIHVNSEGHRFSGVKLKDVNFKRRIYTGLKGYGQSKTAQLLTMLEHDRMLKDSGVTINACHPGAVKTNIGSNNGILYRLFFKYVTSLFLKDVSISSSALYYLAAAPEMEGISGKFFNLTIEETPAKHAINKDMILPVYQLSKHMVGLDDA